VAVAQAVEH